VDILLTVIAILGLGALIIAAWVFVSAARRFVTGEDMAEEMRALNSDLSPYSSGYEAPAKRSWVPRSGSDRRVRSNVVEFPTVINGEFLPRDRRQQPDRRLQA
jgi:hypothetical protein